MAEEEVKTQSETKEKREVKLTAKALLEKVSKLEKERKACFNKLSKLKETIVVLMSSEHVNEVKCEFNNFMGLCEETQQVHKVLLGLLPDDDATKHDTWFNAKMLNVHDFITGTTTWLAEFQSCAASVVTGQTEEQVEGDTAIDNHREKSKTPAVGTTETEIKAAAHDQKNDGNKNGMEAQNKAAVGGHEEEIQIEPHDSISNVASKASRKSSTKGSSTASSSSSKSSAASERIKAEAQRAGLLARAAALRDKHALEEQEHLLRRQREQLELDTEIAVLSCRCYRLVAAAEAALHQSTLMAWSLISLKGLSLKPGLSF